VKVLTKIKINAFGINDFDKILYKLLVSSLEVFLKRVHDPLLIETMITIVKSVGKEDLDQDHDHGHRTVRNETFPKYKRAKIR
jgi:hypothetical protein